MGMKHEAISEQIIGAYFDVYNTLGWGFLESVYQSAMELEMRNRGLRIVPQSRIDVFYRTAKVGTFFADVLVEDAVIVELKACEELAAAHEAQLLNYLKATNIDVGLLLNFGKKSAWKRKVYETARRASINNTQNSPF